ncbi:MAG: hypothetical protein PF518_05550 [Spirochaetaceae bacterium]|jgi:hypothetical protein|nr:hypothetical protein [Spirochaetaceae bacterium]
MNLIKLENYYKSRNICEEETKLALNTLSLCLSYLKEINKNIESCSVVEMKEFLSHLIHIKKNTHEALIALARACYLAENQRVYIYFTQIVERENIIANVKENIHKTIGQEETEALFSSLTPPPTGAAPENAFLFTKELVENLEKQFPYEVCRKALTANAHGIQPEVCEKEVEFFKNAPDLKTYLAEAHKRSVDTLQKHADTGKVWFEQILCLPLPHGAGNTERSQRKNAPRLVQLHIRLHTTEI